MSRENSEKVNVVREKIERRDAIEKSIFQSLIDCRLDLEIGMIETMNAAHEIARKVEEI